MATEKPGNMKKDAIPERILETIGGCGPFQIHLSVLSHVMKLPTVFSMLLMAFSIATPKWTCSDDRYLLLVNTTLQITERLNTYIVYNESVPKTKEDVFQIYNISMEIADYDGNLNCDNRNGTTCVHIDYGTEMNTINSEVRIIYISYETK